jgi:hypothetical protein
MPDMTAVEYCIGNQARRKGKDIMLSDVFQNGAVWLRADFHLHTKEDKKFSYEGDADYYASTYVEALERAGVAVGVITNHNKFIYKEFKMLQKTARRKDIFLLPGVELSVNEGTHGLHVLVVFDDTWIENGDGNGGDCSINSFLSNMFPGKTAKEYQYEGGTSSKNLLRMLDELRECGGRDYFLLFPHVEDAKGLWQEVGGSKLMAWTTADYAELRARTLGFQKVRTRTKREQVKSWLGGWYPAEVEGSDPKNIEGIGKYEDCYLKLGAFTFDAVKFALQYHDDRISKSIPQIGHSHIDRVEFIGGVLDGQTIYFSPELNTLIGIRGSGKSAVIETIRYTLDIPFGENAADQAYKQNLVKYALGSGGKAIIHVKDRYQEPYRVERI